MIKFKGTTIYPPALYDILDNLEYISAYIVEVYTNSLGTDEIRIHVAGKNLNDEREKDIKDHFRTRLRAAPQLTFTTHEALSKIQFPEMSRKPVKFIDNREKVC